MPGRSGPAGRQRPTAAGAPATARATTSKASASIGVAAVGIDAGARSILTQVFGAKREFHRTAFFETMEDAVCGISAADARLAVVEMSLKDGCGILCAAQLMALSPGIKGVLVTTVRDSRVRERATAVGIHGLCCKPLCFGPFLSTLRSVIWSTSPAGRAAPRGREEEVLRCMEQGMLYREIQDAAPTDSQ